MSKKKLVGKLATSSVIVHQYRYFYFLANELAYKALSEKHDVNAFRYTVGTVVMSYTTIETYLNHFSSQKNIHYERYMKECLMNF